MDIENENEDGWEETDDTSRADEENDTVQKQEFQGERQPIGLDSTDGSDSQPEKTAPQNSSTFIAEDQEGTEPTINSKTFGRTTNETPEVESSRANGDAASGKRIQVDLTKGADGKVDKNALSEGDYDLNGWDTDWSKRDDMDQRKNEFLKAHTYASNGDTQEESSPLPSEKENFTIPQYRAMEEEESIDSEESTSNEDFDDEFMVHGENTQSKLHDVSSSVAQNITFGDDPEENAKPFSAVSSHDEEDVEAQKSFSDKFEDENDDRSEETNPSTDSSLAVTPERKVITCLCLCLGCVCCVFAVLIVALIGAAVARRNSETSAPSLLPSIAPTALPTSTPTTAFPTLSPSSVPSTFPTSVPTTGAPSISPTIETSLLEFLIANSFDGGFALLSNGTPQRTAYEWLRENQNLKSYTNETKLTRYALATFFYSTNGPTAWDFAIRNDGWMTDAPECEWASTEKGQCSDGTYASLALDYVGLTGQIPLEIGLLTGLRRFSVRSQGPGTPTLSGSIPESIRALTNLETIRLTDNEIAGTVPAVLGQMANATVLLFNGNYLGGTIPTEIGLTNVATLNFDNNELRGPIPTEIFALENLSTLSLQGNSLTGSIPTQIGNARNLNSINLANNNLVNSIPTEIGKLASIRGKIPTFLWYDI